MADIKLKPLTLVRASTQVLLFNKFIHQKERGLIPSLFLVELKAAKTHTVLYQINRTEYYCQVEVPLSDYPLYGKQLVAIKIRNNI